MMLRPEFSRKRIFRHPVTTDEASCSRSTESLVMYRECLNLLCRLYQTSLRHSATAGKAVAISNRIFLTSEKTLNNILWFSLTNK